MMFQAIGKACSISISMGVELTGRAHGLSGYGVSTWNKDKLMKHPMDLDIDSAILSTLIKMYDLPIWYRS